MTTIMRILLPTVMLITGFGSSIASANAVTSPATSVASSVSAAVPTGVGAPAAVTTRVPATGVPTATFAGATVAAPTPAQVPTVGNIVPRNTGLPGLGEGEEEPPEPQYRTVYSGYNTGFEYYNAGFMSYNQNQVPWVNSSTGEITQSPGDRGISGWGPGGCDTRNPFYWTSGDGNGNGGCGFISNNPPRCYWSFDGPSPFSPYTSWSYGSSWSTDAIYEVLHNQVSLDGGKTWITQSESRGNPVGFFKTTWGDCQFYSAPVSTVESCLTRIGPVTYEGPLQSKGLPAKDFRAGQWRTIPETEYQAPRTIKNAAGTGAWTYVTPIGEVFTTQGGKLRGYGQIPDSLNLTDACQDIEMPLPENIEIPGWGNYKFVKDIQWVECEIVNDPGFGTRNFRGCTDKGSSKDITWAYKICDGDLVWQEGGETLSGPNTEQNFDPTLCDPNPDCMWSNPRTGETKGGRGVPDRFVTSESGQETLVLAGAGTDPDSSVMVAADGRPVRIDTPELTMSIPGGKGSSTYCPEGTQRIDADTCRVFADYTYSTVWKIVRYQSRWVDTSYYVQPQYGWVHVRNDPIWGTVMWPWGGCTTYWWSNGQCLCPAGMANWGGVCHGPRGVIVGWRPVHEWRVVRPGYWVNQGYTAYDPVYDWVTERDPAPAGYSDNGTRWFKDIESTDNTSNTRYTVWEVRRGSTPWAPGGVARNSNPNAGNQPFSSHLPNGASGVLSMTGSGVDKFDTGTDGYRWNADELAKDPTTGSASRPLSVAGGSQWALDMELNFYEPAAQYSDVLNENRFVVRGHFQQLWNEEFTLNSVSKFKTMYTPSGASPYIGIVEGPTRTQRFEITETCSTAEQNFTVVGTRNSPN